MFAFSGAPVLNVNMPLLVKGWNKNLNLDHVDYRVQLTKLNNLITAGVSDGDKEVVARTFDASLNTDNADVTQQQLQALKNNDAVFKFASTAGLKEQPHDAIFGTIYRLSKGNNADDPLTQQATSLWQDFKNNGAYTEYANNLEDFVKNVSVQYLGASHVMYGAPRSGIFAPRPGSRYGK